MEYVRETIAIDAPIGRVWAVTSGFGGLEVWCPAIKSMELRGHGVGSIRIAYLDGAVSYEQLLEVDAERHTVVYALIEPLALPLTGIRSTLALEPSASGGTDVVWFSQADDCPPEVWGPVGELVGEFYRENLRALKALTEADRVVRRLL